MSIFETFYLLFKADSSQLKKEVDDVKKKTGELTKTSKDSEDQAKKTDNAFSGLAGTLGKVAAGFFSVGAVVSGFKNSFNNTQGIGDLSRNFGLDPEKLDAYRKSIRTLGYDAEAATSELLDFAKAWRLDPNVALSFLPAFADKLKSLGSITAAQGYGPQANLGPTLVSILYNEEGKLLKEAFAQQQLNGVVSQEDIEAARAFNAELAKLDIAFDKLFRTISTDLLPGLTGFITELTKLTSFFTGYKKWFEESPEQKADRLYAEKREAEILPGFLKEGSVFNPKTKKGSIWDLLFGGGEEITNPWATDYGWNKHREIPNQSYYQPTMIPSVTNSQAASVTTGDITINTTAQDAKGIASSIVGEINTQSKTLLAQLQQSNAYHDNGVIV